MKRSALLLLAIIGSFISCDKTSSSEITEEEMEGYSSTTIELISGISFTSQITTSLDYNNRPSNDVLYVTNSQEKIFVYTDFKEIGNGFHEYSCNVSSADQQGIVMNAPMNFEVTKGQHQVWTWIESNWLLGPGDYTMDVYLDGKLQFRKPFKILTQEEETSGDFPAYWLEKNYFPMFTSDSDKLSETWRVNDFYYLSEKVVSVIPVVHEGFNRMFVVVNQSPSNYELFELQKGEKKSIRKIKISGKRKVKFHSEVSGNQLILYNSFKTNDMKIDLTTGEWQPFLNNNIPVAKPNEFPSPDGNKKVVKSCREGVSLLMNGSSTKIKDLNCDVSFGWASWNDTGTVFYFEDTSGLYSYAVLDQQLTQILFQPDPVGAAYFNNNGMDMVAYYGGETIYVASNNLPNAWFHDEFDSENKFGQEVTTSLTNDQLLINYYPESTEIVNHSADYEMESLQTTIHEIGQVANGNYLGAKILKLEINWSYEDKGESELYYSTNWTYALSLNNEITFLTAHLSKKNNTISTDGQSINIVDPGFALNRTSIFENIGSFKINNSTTIPELEIPQTQLIGEIPLVLVATLNGWNKENFKPLNGNSDWFLTSQDDGSFNKLLPDGSRLVYTYDWEKITPFEVTPFDTNLTFEDYVPFSDRTCSGRRSDLAYIVNPAIDDLIKLGTLGNKTIYSYQDNSHAVLKSAYEAYKEIHESGMSGDESDLIEFDVFWEYTPILLWEDGLGRMVQFRLKQFLPPLNCEPIVYFYPEKETEINFSLGKRIEVLASYPAYQDGWKLMVNPEGKLIDAKNGKFEHRIFWEGKSGYLPKLEEGHVVARSEIDEFLTNRLKGLGLNPFEIDEFKTAWLESLSEKPHCFIGFYDQEIINSYAPINIDPKPKSIIRILMDYETLDDFKNVKTPIDLPTPLRNGFTVVEWGGLKR